MKGTSKVNLEADKALYLEYKKFVGKKGLKLKLVTPNLFEQAIKSFIERCKNEGKH